MLKIHKYTLGENASQAIEIPHLTKILSVAEQYDKIVLYVLVDDENNQYKKITVYILATGEQSSCLSYDKIDFIGTVKLYNGQMFFHVFVKKD